MTCSSKDWLTVGLPLLALLVLGVAAQAHSWSDVLVTAFTVAALAGLGGLDRAGVPVAAGEGAERTRARGRKAG